VDVPELGMVSLKSFTIGSPLQTELTSESL
jgi:hypothetical protein